ncbi:dihydrodipicolinate synthase family protein [Bacillus sp. 2205SS5-2]|uniref:dihydrodipicolinate synthase family protein n=1 Tax=Bacillus sp. 2205SS5-2 TaxID=3109031 RepID=UPI00300576CE
MKNPFVPFSIAMITPFSKNGELYLEGIPSLIDYYKKHDVPSLLISGSTGEQHSMTIEERASLFHAVKKETKNDLRLYGGVAAVQSGKEEGKKYFTEISPYMNSILEMGTLRPIKYLLEKQNIQAGVCLEPLSTLSVEEKKIIDKVFQSF